MATPRSNPDISAADFLPAAAHPTLKQLQKAAAGCAGCDLYHDATQTVFGEGPEKARIIFIGEQPGDQEDQRGRPFVGPAGRVLDQALVEAGIDREETYVTNTVKHFKFTRRGRRRLHVKPTASEIRACQPWLEAEINVLGPQAVVALGATAAKSMMGSAFRITRQRGQVFTDTRWGPRWMAALHPSAILRMPDGSTREQAFTDLVHDLGQIA